jgi:hypothetical protein
MKENVNAKWHLPKSLQVTDEMMPAIEKAQAEIAARVASPFASLTPQEQERARAQTLVKELTEQLQHVQKRISKVFTRGGADHFDELLKTQRSLWRQLAEAHASTGRFDLAAEYTDDKTAEERRQKAEYIRIWRAVWRDDSHFCACGPHRGSGKNASLEVPASYVKKDIFSVAHNAVMPLVACSKCKCMNVMPLPKALAEQRSARAQAHALAGDLKPADAAARLREANHTTEALTR